ncbi:MAG TPA: 4-hydroxythreonine-4-phosphate dehydrogenase PdxA [Woeseiaceae bacterium]|nr:4-hydroxythreonine-4-phosphate dehydrogenase PdxA [Woeseiaceae bacterium]
MSARIPGTGPLVITAGEPSGIGPDLCLALGNRDDLPRLLVIGDEVQLRQRADLLGIEFNLDVLHLPFPVAVQCGSPNPDNAPALLEGLQLAVAGCLAGEYAGLVTAPLAKNVINDAGIPFTGHTEYLAALCGAALPVMLLVAGDLRVALASTHLPLRDVPDYISQDRLRSIIEVLHADLRHKFAIPQPEIVVCGLNPHAGEGGYLGHEDQQVIAPVIAEMQAQGMQIRGPIPADTAFTPAAGERDAVLAMYHDQGLPVLKYAGFGHAVNVTLGLPIIRTSVDHGTAFDLAGTGKADAGSLLAAIRLAEQLVTIAATDAARA